MNTIDSIIQEIATKIINEFTNSFKITLDKEKVYLI